MKQFYSSISITVILFTIFYSFFSLMPQQTTAETKQGDFLIKNALKHLKEISKQPHYVGSENHTTVRNYIKSELEKLGLTIEIQRATTFNTKSRSAVRVKNIITRIKGTSNDKALLLLTHYDSCVSTSFGASDAGSGAVTILEGIRAFLSKNKQPKNDIIICFSDAEEIGLLGANTFVKNHKWTKKIGLVLNFEARGSGGPSLMLMETNGGNKRIIEEFSKANTPYPAGNSLLYSIYKMLPNDTDLTVFREDANINGLNFAFIDDHYDYHTAQDTYDRLDLNTLEHQLSYLGKLLNHFAYNSTELQSTEDYVYFNFPKIGMIYYPFSWAIPVLISLFILFLGLLILARKKAKITSKGNLKGFIPLFISLISSGIIGFFGWRFILTIYPNYKEISHGFTYNGYTYILAFVFISIAIFITFYKKYLRNYQIQDLLIAPILLWFLLNLGFVLFLKGASYFIIPVIVLLISFTLSLFEKNNIVISTFLTIPILIIFSPLVKLFPVGLGLKMMFTSTILVSLLCSASIHLLNYYKFKHLNNVFFVATLITLSVAHLNSGYDENNKKPNSIIYVYNQETDKSYWVSYDENLDDFTQQFFNGKSNESDILGITGRGKHSVKKIKYCEETSNKKLNTPQFTIISDTIINKFRRIKFKIKSNRSANKIELFSDKAIPFIAIGINEFHKESSKEMAYMSGKGSVIKYYFTETNEEVVFDFTIPKDINPNFSMLESKFDLLKNNNFSIKPRSKNMMPKPFIVNDATVIKMKLCL